MSILRLVEVSAASARAAIDTATAASADPDAAVMRVGVLEFLRVHASRVQAEGHDAELLEAYRRWLDLAVEVYAGGDPERIPEYMRRAALFGAELDLAEARANGTLAASPSAAPQARTA